MDKLSRALTIACDIDGPIFWDEGQMGSFLLYVRQQGYECDHDTFVRTGSIAQACTDLPRSQLSQLWFDFQESTNIFSHPTPGMRQAIRKLQCHRLVITTARDEGIKRATMLRLHRFCGSRFNQYHFSLDDKSIIIKQIHAHFMIEDNLSTAEAVAQAVPQCQVILFPTPYIVRHSRVPNLICLPCEADVKPDLTTSQWRIVCQRAWRAIVSIISSNPFHI